MVRRGRLDLDHAADRVFDLVHVVEMPAGDEQLALVQIAAGQDPATAAQFHLADVAGRDKSLAECAETVTIIEGTTVA